MTNLKWKCCPRSHKLNEGRGDNDSITIYKIITLYDYNIKKDVAIINQGESILLKGDWHNFKISLLELGHLFSPALGHHHFLGLWTPAKVYTTGPPGFQAFRLGLNYTSGFPGSPDRQADSRQQTVGFLCLCNRVSQFLQ